MEIKPETVKKVAYPALAAVMAAALSSCQQQQQYPEQRCSGSGLSSVDLKAYGFLIGQQNHNGNQGRTAAASRRHPSCAQEILIRQTLSVPHFHSSPPRKSYGN